MKRPQKRKLDHSKPDFISNNKDALYGYNQCKEEFEKYLPSKEWILAEIEKCKITCSHSHRPYEGYFTYDIQKLAKSIHRRIHT